MDRHTQGDKFQRLSAEDVRGEDERMSDPNFKDHAIPFNIRPKGEHRLISQKGGQAATQAKKDAATLREIKKKLEREGLTDDSKKWVLEILDNRPAMAAQILLTAEKVRKNLEDFGPIAQVAYANYEVNAMKVIHGEKSKIETTNTNINIDLNDLARQVYLQRKQENEREKSKQGDSNG